jgi:hypothetical protein
MPHQTNDISDLISQLRSLRQMRQLSHATGSATSPIKSDGMRVAYAILYMPDGTKYDGKKHVVTDPLNLTIGDKLEGEMFASVE